LKIHALSKSILGKMENKNNEKYFGVMKIAGGPLQLDM
jgi:hypothetical protein